MVNPYRLTPRMIQTLENLLKKYHDLFSGGRCAGWELEELVVKAIKSDTKANHHVRWREGGHDFKEDVNITINGRSHSIQIKSGKTQSQNNSLVLSGNRLGRFNGDFDKITDFLNNKKEDIISFPYEVIDNEHGRTHKYQLIYIDVNLMTGITKNGWKQKGKQFIQQKENGVNFSLRPSMSWQIWWTIPLPLLEKKILSI